MYHARRRTQKLSITVNSFFCAGREQDLIKVSHLDCNCSANFVVMHLFEKNWQFKPLAEKII